MTSKRTNSDRGSESPRPGGPSHQPPPNLPGPPPKGPPNRPEKVEIIETPGRGVTLPTPTLPMKL